MDKVVVEKALDVAAVAPQTLKVHVTNPTPYVRRQPIIFGTKDSTPFTYFKLPASSLNTGWVKVPANFKGEVDVVPSNNKTFVLHPSIQKAIDAGFQPLVTINGQRFDLVFTGTPIAHKDVTIFEFANKNTYGVAKLWAYVFSSYPVVHFEVAFYHESLTIASRPITFNFSVQAKTQVFSKVYVGTAPNLINNLMMDDGQGRVWKGVFLFYDPAAPDIVKLDFQTGFSEYEYPLFAMSKWPVWGPWGVTIPPISRQKIDNELSRRVSINYADPLGHFGQIGAMMAGQTGDQAGWGTWQQYLSVGGNTSELMPYDYLAAMQDNCRPVHFFDIDGKRFKSTNHPNCVFWSQRYHWHPVVSPDRLLRENQVGGFVNQWTGYDDQHCGGMVIANQVILNGSMAAYEYCKSHIQAIKAQQTLPSVKPGWSTNFYQAGRSSRMYMTAYMHYLATGDSEGISHIAKQMNELLFPNWFGTLHPSALIKPTAVRGPGVQAGELINYPSWTVWEDGLFAMNADVLWPVFAKLGLTAEADKLRGVVWDVAKSVAKYGWHPTRLEVAVCLKWNGDGSLCEDYLDEPNKAKYYHAYNAWMLPCLKIAKREAERVGDTETATQAVQRYEAVLAVYQQNNPDYVVQFLGAD